MADRSTTTNARYLSAGPRAEVEPLVVPPVIIVGGAATVWILRGTAAAGLIYQQWDYFGELIGIGNDDELPETLWMKFVVTYADTNSQDNADDQQWSFEVVNYTNGQPDNTWTQGDFDSILGRLSTLVTALAPHIASRYSYAGVKAYLRAFNVVPDPYPLPPYTESNPKPKAFADTGPPLFVSSATLASTGSGSLPAQGCSTVTEIVPNRGNWGRLYLPTLSSTCYASTSGRVNTANMTAILTAFQTFYQGNLSAQYIPVVPITSVGGNPIRALSQITDLRIDDVPDVIRRRRLKNSLVVSTLPV